MVVCQTQIQRPLTGLHNFTVTTANQTCTPTYFIKFVWMLTSQGTMIHEI